ncbi:hypothetical protein NM208_g3172 [Fusarium decemcellulare]|uniref:Uncharacterized protein n=1 Tax=Fusarium decemcellulare TaxID=57161 RepID=A0ACC1SQC2_9HYPO|nr:hypothetical protein NM208_g3172 [Fusarium decemcellulare]
MALSKFFVVVMATLANFSHAAPAPISNRQDSSLPFPVEHFTKTVASVQNTYCGSAANQPGVKFGDQTLLYALGNGDTVQRTNIYHSNSLGIIVAYQGTNLSSIVSIAQDIEALPVLPDPRLGLPIGSLVFAGWQVAWTNGWSAVKAALADVIKTYPNDKVIVTGHSQGAAIALLGALSIRKEFGDVIEEVIAYGIPRVGNPTFANAFDAAFGGKYTGVVNGQDWVPSFPTRPVYRHPSGMVWINPANTTSWQFYEGQENPNGPSSRIGKIFYPGTFQFYWGHRRDHLYETHNNLPGTISGYHDPEPVQAFQDVVEELPKVATAHQEAESLLSKTEKKMLNREGIGARRASETLQSWGEAPTTSSNIEATENGQETSDTIDVSPSAIVKSEVVESIESSIQDVTTTAAEPISEPRTPRDITTTAEPPLNNGTRSVSSSDHSGDGQDIGQSVLREDAVQAGRQMVVYESPDLSDSPSCHIGRSGDPAVLIALDDLNPDVPLSSLSFPSSSIDPMSLRRGTCGDDLLLLSSENQESAPGAQQPPLNHLPDSSLASPSMDSIAESMVQPPTLPIVGSANELAGNEPSSLPNELKGPASEKRNLDLEAGRTGKRSGLDRDSSDPEHKRQSNHSLTASKVYKQLTSDVGMTDDVVNFLCQIIRPKPVKGLNDGRQIGFIIHYPGHWTSGFAVHHEYGFTIQLHDGIQVPERCDDVRESFKALLNKCGIEEQVEVIPAPGKETTGAASLLSLLRSVDTSTLRPPDVSVIKELRACETTSAQASDPAHDTIAMSTYESQLDAIPETEICRLIGESSTLLENASRVRAEEARKLAVLEVKTESVAEIRAAMDLATDGLKKEVDSMTAPGILGRTIERSREALVEGAIYYHDCIPNSEPDMQRSIVVARDYLKSAEEELERAETRLNRLNRLLRAKMIYGELIKERQKVLLLSQQHSTFRDMSEAED